MLKRGLCCVVLALPVLLAAAIFVQYAPRYSPSVLAVHVDPVTLRFVDVESSNLGNPVSFKKPGPVVKVSPISYGPYLLRVRFADGREVWATYFHLDAGVRRRVDIYITCKSGSDSVQFRCVIHNRPSLFSESSETLYDGTIEASKTSREHPLVLAWV